MRKVKRARHFGGALYVGENPRLEIGTIIIAPPPKMVDLWLDEDGNLCARWKTTSPKKCAVIKNIKEPA